MAEWIGEQAVSDLDEDRIIEMMVGRRLEEQYPRLGARAWPGWPAGERSGWSRRARGELLPASGENWGISGGLMGSGRTELMKLIYGASPSAPAR